MAAKKMTVLEEAEGLVNGDRRGDYGPPEESFDMIGGFWATYLGVEITRDDVAQMMVLLKLARSRSAIARGNRPQRDSIVDASGYLRCIEMMGPLT